MFPRYYLTWESGEGEGGRGAGEEEGRRENRRGWREVRREKETSLSI